KNRMGVRIDEARQDHLAATIDFDDVLAVFLDPRIRQRIFGFADRDNFPAYTYYCAVFDDAEFPKVSPSPRARCAGSRAQSKELTDI
ncbi:MAG TPA: hypothetical protein VGV15_08155, partial [Terriglobales bacterium]|nr:hypothetical protein [Terriglobales bacterium]